MDPSFSLPPKSLRFMAEDDDKFLTIAHDNWALLERHGLKADDTLLDLGCGYGRLTYGLDRHAGFRGTYVGFDILKKQIDWCKETIQARVPNYSFHHIDVQNDRYNAKGATAADAWRCSYPDNHFNFACLFSVFTHMYEDDILHYLNELHRMLRPGGRCLATIFVYDEERLKIITAPNHGLRMQFELNDHTRYRSEEDKLLGISYKQSFIESLVAKTGFKLVHVRRGLWAGGSESFQDYLLLEKVVA